MSEFYEKRIDHVAWNTPGVNPTHADELARRMKAVMADRVSAAQGAAEAALTKLHESGQLLGGQDDLDAVREAVAEAIGTVEVSDG